MNKKIITLISIFLFVLITAGVAVQSFAYESPDGMWSYSLNSGKANITAYHGSASKVTIPAKIDGYDVELVGAISNLMAKDIVVSEGITKVSFGRNIYIQTVQLPSTVVEIGSYGFYDAPLKEINFPSSLTTIGASAFADCDYSGSVILSEGLTTIGKEAFRASNIKEIHIPGTVEEVPYYCCYSTNLEKVVIAEGVKKLGFYAFARCSSLKEVYIPRSVINIDSSFENDPNVVIYGYKNSAAESYAEENNYKFVAIIPVTGISVAPTEITLASGKTSQLTYSITPGNANNQNVSWTSSKPSVATVSAKGLVTSVSEGTAVITAKTEDGGFEASCTVTVHDHSYNSSVESPATCTKEGVMRYTCSCGDTYTKPINKTAHNYVGQITTPAGCTTQGVKTFTCSKCSAYYTETINPTGHSMTSSVSKSPTCTEKGIKHFWCTKCDYNYDSEIPANGHSMTSSVSKSPTCTERGIEHFWCTKCDYNYDSEIPANGHNVSSNISKPATCTEDGIMHYYCTRCEYGYDTVIHSEGHKYGAWEVVTPPTNTKNGMEKRVCSVCQAFETREVPAEGKISYARVTINNNPGRKTVNYREGIILTANVSGQASGDKIVWYVNNQKYCEGNTFEYREIKSGITVKAVLVDKDGKEYYDSNDNAVSDEEKIEVKADFFTKLIAFFKGLFGGNSVITQ